MVLLSLLQILLFWYKRDNLIFIYLDCTSLPGWLGVCVLNRAGLTSLQALFKLSVRHNPIVCKRQKIIFLKLLAVFYGIGATSSIGRESYIVLSQIMSLNLARTWYHQSLQSQYKKIKGVIQHCVKFLALVWANLVVLHIIWSLHCFAHSSFILPNAPKNWFWQMLSSANSNFPIFSHIILARSPWSLLAWHYPLLTPTCSSCPFSPPLSPPWHPLSSSLLCILSLMYSPALHI